MRKGYNFDVWGNITSRYGWGGTNPEYTATFNSNNRMVTNPGTGQPFSYDAAGNVTSEGGQTFSYDATGQQATASTYGLQQSHDGDRLRGKKVDDGATTYYLRSSVLGGQVVAEINSSGTWTRGYVYLGGQLLALQGNSAVTWVHQEPYSKGQRMTNAAGNVVSTIELDPFGGETDRSENSAFQPHKYTSYERDANQSDDAMNRRYNRWWSRFDQPDPYDGSYDFTNPQSFNRYAYVNNDPVNFTDPTGLNASDCPAEFSSCGGGWDGRGGDGGMGGSGFGGGYFDSSRFGPGSAGEAAYVQGLQNTYDAMDANRELQRYIRSEGTDEEALQALARFMAGNSSLSFAIQSRSNQAQPAAIAPILARILAPIGRALLRLLGRGRAPAAAATASTALRSVEDIFSNPRLLAGRTPGEIAQLVKKYFELV